MPSAWVTEIRHMRHSSLLRLRTSPESSLQRHTRANGNADPAIAFLSFTARSDSGCGASAPASASEA
eukprot:665898-Prymnesium_polylepis.2